MSLEIKNLHKTFGDYKALVDINFSVAPGSLCALLGPSGSGKTTLLRIIAGLEMADEHKDFSISFNGLQLGQLPAAKRSIGFVFQNYALFDHMSVADNVAFGLHIKPRKQRPSAAQIKSKVEELLAMVHLEGLQGRMPHELSGGQRQRVALARALAIQPRLLLLDEPFGALDAKVRKELRRSLLQLQHELGITTLFVTHDQQEALEMADSVVVMRSAHIEQIGTAQQVFDQPSSEFVYEFLGEINRMPDGSLVRPHELQLYFANDEDAQYRGTIRHLFLAGPIARLTIVLDHAGNPEVEVWASRQQVGEMQLECGDFIGAGVKKV